MNSFRDVFSPDGIDGGPNLDGVIRSSLELSVGRSEPPAGIWERIEREIDSQQVVVVKQSVFSGLFQGLVRVSVYLDEALFAPPDWQERLTHHKMQLVTQIVACPGANHISLAVV